MNDAAAQPAQTSSMTNTEKPTEFTGRASQSQLSSSPTDADHGWNTDTGASAHMTPRQDWLRDYQPKCIPIKLVDNTTVYSEGVGSVLFHPQVNRKEARSVEISQVLHVPKLQNNLLSILCLTRKS